MDWNSRETLSCAVGISTGLALLSHVGIRWWVPVIAAAVTAGSMRAARVMGNKAKIQTAETTPEQPPGGWDEWRRYELSYPRGHSIVEIWRPGWPTTRTFAPDSRENLAMNVHGLYWRPVSAGGETIN
jgi:hypothetical protein